MLVILTRQVGGGKDLFLRSKSHGVFINVVYIRL